MVQPWVHLGPPTQLGREHTHSSCRESKKQRSDVHSEVSLRQWTEGTAVCPALWAASDVLTEAAAGSFPADAPATGGTAHGLQASQHRILPLLRAPGIEKGPQRVAFS